MRVLLWQGVLSSQPLSVSGCSTVPGQQFAGLLRPVTAASRSAVHIGTVPSTLPGVQFISKPVQILQCNAASTAQLLPAVTTINQVNRDLELERERENLLAKYMAGCQIRLSPIVLAVLEIFCDQVLFI